MSEYMRGGSAAHVPAVSRSAAKTKGRPSLIKQQARMQWWSQGVLKPPYYLGFHRSPPTNFVEEEGRRKF